MRQKELTSMTSRFEFPPIMTTSSSLDYLGLGMSCNVKDFVLGCFLI